MCVSPITTMNGLASCGSCRQCIDNRKNDYVGRCVAESYGAVRTDVVEFTYATIEGRDMSDLVYRDVQLAVKTLRNMGYRFRYLIVGENGSLRGRAHWHCVFFWTGDKVPDRPPLHRRVNWFGWPHGFSYFREGTIAGVRYALKYALKTDQNPAYTAERDKWQRVVRVSQNLGDGFFLERAIQLAVSSVLLDFPAIAFRSWKRRKDGRNKMVGLFGGARDRFISVYVALRQRICPDWHEGLESDWLQNYLEKRRQREVSARDLKAIVGRSSPVLGPEIPFDACFKTFVFEGCKRLVTFRRLRGTFFEVVDGESVKRVDLFSDRAFSAVFGSGRLALPYRVFYDFVYGRKYDGEQIAQGARKAGELSSVLYCEDSRSGELQSLAGARNWPYTIRYSQGSSASTWEDRAFALGPASVGSPDSPSAAMVARWAFNARRVASAARQGAVVSGYYPKIGYACF